MRIDLSVGTPRIHSAAIHGASRQTATTEAVASQALARSFARAVMIVGALLIEAILIVGLVVATLGLGHESQPGTGPDRPPRLQTPAPGSPPDRLGITP